MTFLLVNMSYYAVPLQDCRRIKLQPSIIKTCSSVRLFCKSRISQKWSPTVRQFNIVVLICIYHRCLQWSQTSKHLCNSFPIANMKGSENFTTQFWHQKAAQPCEARKSSQKHLAAVFYFPSFQFPEISSLLSVFLAFRDSEINLLTLWENPSWANS